MMTLNRSVATAGLDDPTKQWMQRLVTVQDHPEWGVSRVLRWFPAEGNEPERLRVMPEGHRQPQLVRADAVAVVTRRS
ncbi:MAG: hypothetical protein HY903_24675 [Deltaproteobacteria bacterium]|nr:hypothetical protein [Deltaproteobacteria bacterium]